MPVIRMALTNYRCFLRRQAVELRPVTLLLGRNNSGKSALARAPLVLSKGFRTSSPDPLDLDALGEGMVDSFVDLIYGGRPHGKIRFELDLMDENFGPLSFDVSVQNIAEFRLQVVSELAMRVGHYPYRRQNVSAHSGSFPGVASGCRRVAR
jgi:predicted ATPase